MEASRVDSHAHIWRLSRTPQPWIDVVSMAAIARDFWIDDLSEQQRGSGIVSSLLVQSSNTHSETRDLLAAVANHNIAGVIGWLDLESDVARQLERIFGRASGEKLLGVRHLAHQDEDAEWLGRAGVSNGLDEMAVAGLPFDLVIRPDQLELATTVAAKHPRTTFVLDHLGNPPISQAAQGRWRASLRQMASHPNVVAKLSGVVTSAPGQTWSRTQIQSVVHFALETFGPGRLLYGSDWPVVELSMGSAKWAAELDLALAGLSAAERQAIHAGNAVTTYGLST